MSTKGTPRLIVTKVGSSILTDASGKIDRGNFQRLVTEIAGLMREGRQIVLVSSGAIATGAEKLGRIGQLKTLPEKQAAAAVGQVILMELYQQAFAGFGYQVAQVLLTRDAIEDRHRYINARNTMTELLSMGVIPIVNENDTVAVEEIKVGDNDTLSALVASLVGADLMINLTNTDGFYIHKEDGSLQLLHKVEAISKEIRSAAGGSIGSTTVGGMQTKIEAAEICMRAGIPMVIANGKDGGILARVISGESVGTRFAPAASKPESRKRWLLHGLRPKGKLVVDDGAAKVLKSGGKSLLPVGVTRVSGKFEAGDLVSVVDGKAHELARGLTNYSSEEAAKICGKKSGEIAEVLGYVGVAEVIHRDNLVLL